MKQPKEDKDIHIVKRFMARVPWTFCEKYVDDFDKVTAFPYKATCEECKKKRKGGL